MSIVCSICHDCLTEKPQSLREGEDLIIIALQCGHIYHDVCIQQWFRNGGTRAGLNNNGVECPCCKKISSLNNALRLYPTCEQDTEEPQLSHKLKKDILAELEECNQIMAQLSFDLSVETDAQDKLRLENGQLQSELHELKEKIKETEEIYKTLEESLKFKIQTLEKGIDEAKQVAYEARARERGIFRRLELLKSMQEESRKALLAQKSVEEDCVDQIILTISNLSPLEADHFSEVGDVSSTSDASLPVPEEEEEDFLWG